MHNEIPELGDLVLSLRGRDAGRVLYVVGVRGDDLLLADGRVRMIELPKRKKRKHVRWADRPEDRVRHKLCLGQKVLNSELRKAIAAWSATGDKG